MDGALLINKHAGVSSFGIIEELQRELTRAGRTGVNPPQRDLPKMGHGGTLDPFATGLLVVCVGRGVKLARYFLGSRKTYEGVIRFGETTVPGRSDRPDLGDAASTFPRRSKRSASMAASSDASALSSDAAHALGEEKGRQAALRARAPRHRDRARAQALSSRIRSRSSYGTAARAFRLMQLGHLRAHALAGLRTHAGQRSAMLDSPSPHGRLGPLTSKRVDGRAEYAKRLCHGRKRGTNFPAGCRLTSFSAGYDRAVATAEERNAIFQGRQNGALNILRRVEPQAPRMRPPSGPRRLPGDLLRREARRHRAT